MSGGARLFAQCSDEAVRKVPADRLLEPLQSRLLRSAIRGGEGRDVREYPRRGRGSDLYEHGGTHGTGIGNGPLAGDPWRE